MSKLLILALALAGGYAYLSAANPRLLRQMHLSAPSGGGSLNPVMGGMATGIGGGAVRAAGRIGG